MVRAIERIEQDILALEQAIAATAEDLYRSYDSYLVRLGRAARQQLIMASYYLCTQGYPHLFLQLPFAQRQQLQQDLKQLAQQTQQALQDCLTTIAPSDLSDDSTADPGQGSILESLGRWQVQLERSLMGQLRLASKKANQTLVEAGILSGELPEPLLDAAFKPDAINDMMPTPPNILHLVLETEIPSGGTQAADHPEDTDNPDDEDQELRSFPLRIMALRLRLADIEFADAEVLAGRSQIRNLLSRLAGLDREYEKKQQERAIAAAEAAWRASWSDE